MYRKVCIYFSSSEDANSTPYKNNEDQQLLWHRGVLYSTRMLSHMVRILLVSTSKTNKAVLAGLLIMKSNVFST